MFSNVQNVKFFVSYIESNDFVPHQDTDGSIEVEFGGSSWGSRRNWQDWDHKRSGKGFG